MYSAKIANLQPILTLLLCCSFSSCKYFNFLGGKKVSASEKPILLDRETFSLNYPENWKIDKRDKDYDADENFSIEDSNDAYAMFMIANTTLEADSLVENTAKETATVFRKPIFTAFNRYGAYYGVGKMINGKAMGFKTTVRIFSCSSCDNTFLVTEFHYDENEKYSKPGLEMIEKSFKLKRTPTKKQ